MCVCAGRMGVLRFFLLQKKDTSTSLCYLLVITRTLILRIMYVLTYLIFPHYLFNTVCYFHEQAGQTPLCVAALYGEITTVQLLVNNNAYIDTSDKVLLYHISSTCFAYLTLLCLCDE